MIKHRWLSLLFSILLALGCATACKYADTNQDSNETITETFSPPPGTTITVETFRHEGVDYYLINFPPGTQPDPRTSALRNAADKIGEDENGGFIIQIRTSLVVDYFLDPDNHNLSIQIIVNK